MGQAEELLNSLAVSNGIAKGHEPRWLIARMPEIVHHGFR